MKTNATIRESAKKKGVKHWQIAMYLGVSEPTFVRWLRVPFSPEKEKSVLLAIDEIAKGAR